MSYYIFYDKQFVKLSNGNYIPMVLAGSSNCYDMNNKRERDWLCDYNLVLKNKTMANNTERYFAPADILLNNVELDIKETVNQYSKEATESEIRSNLGWYTALRLNSKNITDKSYKSFVSSGIKNALDIETLASLNIRLQFRTDTMYTNYDIPAPQSSLIKTEADFYSELETWLSWQSKVTATDTFGDKNPHKASVYLGFWENYDTVLNSLKNYRKKNSPVKAKKEVKQPEKVIAVLVNNAYIEKVTRRGIHLTHYISRAKAFLTNTLAEKYIDNLKPRYSKCEFGTQEINNPLYNKN